MTLKSQFPNMEKEYNNNKEWNNNTVNAAESAFTQ